MRLYAAEGTLILGKRRRDGSRRVLAVRCATGRLSPPRSALRKCPSISTPTAR